MKNIKFLAGLFLIFTAFTFTSCDNEPIDPEIDLGPGNGGGNRPARRGPERDARPAGKGRAGATAAKPGRPPQPADRTGRGRAPQR